MPFKEKNHEFFSLFVNPVRSCLVLQYICKWFRFTKDTIKVALCPSRLDPGRFSVLFDAVNQILHQIFNLMALYYMESRSTNKAVRLLVI